MSVIVKFFIRVLNKLQLLDFLNINATLLLNNKAFKIPIIQKVGLSNLHMSEPWMIQILQLVIPLKQGKFIDVGVNVGQTLIKLKSVSEEIDYIGFEPNPICYHYAKQLIRLNNFKNITIVPVGLSDTSNLGVLHFFSNSSVDASASMISNFRDEAKVLRKEFIPLFAIKDLEKILQLEDLAILKIDVEGAELDVIKSFYHKIKVWHPIILMEILPSYSKEYSERINRQQELISLLKSANYSIYRIELVGESLKGFNKLEEIEIHSDLNACEYVMVPKNVESHFFDKIQHLKFNN